MATTCMHGKFGEVRSVFPEMYTCGETDTQEPKVKRKGRLPLASKVRVMVSKGRVRPS